MKKYKLTKITIKTKEIISLPVSAAHENETAICPVCHAPLATASLSADENSINKYLERQSTENSAAANNQEKQS